MSAKVPPPRTLTPEHCEKLQKDMLAGLVTSSHSGRHELA